MPQADLYVTADQNVPGAEMLAAIEDVIAGFDSGAGACKGRLHVVEVYHHSHVLLRLSMLPKDYRDGDYAKELGKRLAEVIRPCGVSPCAMGVNISFDLVNYTSTPL